MGKYPIELKKANKGWFKMNPTSEVFCAGSVALLGGKHNQL